MSADARKKILDKIAKLRAMTQANGATEAEALLAAERLSRLLEEYHVSQTEADLHEAARGGGITRIKITLFGSQRPAWFICIAALNQILGNKGWTSPGSLDLLGLGVHEPVIYYHIMGFEENLQTVDQIADLIREAFIYEGKAYIKRTKTDRNLKDFNLGMAMRIEQRIREMFTPKISLRESNGRALIDLRNQLVTEEFAKLNLNLRPGRAMSGDTSSKAYQAGVAAGGRANLHGKVPASMRLTKG